MLAEKLQTVADSDAVGVFQAGRDRNTEHHLGIMGLSELLQLLMSICRLHMCNLRMQGRIPL